jgi:hypothetical protein
MTHKEGGVKCWITYVDRFEVDRGCVSVMHEKILWTPVAVDQGEAAVGILSDQFVDRTSQIGVPRGH